ncbi:hypothetical protein [Oerskovia merdavium]|uniref:ABC transporter permease n=1 Tax=Oerskovia merdavium TaxID=2762227 RepID=A0ABR8U4I8_9CELL|nr:hypothetical protein [Oerskovia merdavium]MBD7982925.1 hypothetical protein [Oerskovia merdavium]
MDSVLGFPVPVMAGLFLGLVSLLAAVLLWWDGRRVVAPTTAARRAVRHASLASGAAALPLVVGLGLAPMYFVGGLFWFDGHTAAVLPIASLLGVLGVYAAGEATWPRPQGAQRLARLTVRTVEDVAPRGLQRLVWVWCAAIATVSAVFGLLASGPRSISRVIALYQAHTVGPFPGWLWTVPILVATMLVVVLLDIALRFIATRLAIEDVDEGWDMWLRRRVARRILRTVQAVLGFTLAGLLALAGLAYRWLGLGNGAGSHPDVPISPEHVTAGNALLLVALILAVAALAAALWPARDIAPDCATIDEAVEARA